nr:uncharacterized protein LOC108175627 [Oryctolagus cuniculus]
MPLCKALRWGLCNAAAPSPEDSTLAAVHPVLFLAGIVVKQCLAAAALPGLGCVEEEAALQGGPRAGSWRGRRRTTPAPAFAFPGVVPTRGPLIAACVLRESFAGSGLWDPSKRAEGRGSPGVLDGSRSHHRESSRVSVAAADRGAGARSCCPSGWRNGRQGRSLGAPALLPAHCPARKSAGARGGPCSRCVPGQKPSRGAVSRISAASRRESGWSPLRLRRPCPPGPAAGEAGLVGRGRDWRPRPSSYAAGQDGLPVFKGLAQTSAASPQAFLSWFDPKQG